MPASFTTYLEICTRIIFCNLKLGCLQHSALLKKNKCKNVHDIIHYNINRSHSSDINI